MVIGQHGLPKLDFPPTFFFTPAALSSLDRQSPDKQELVTTDGDGRSSSLGRQVVRLEELKRASQEESRRKDKLDNGDVESGIRGGRGGDGAKTEVLLEQGEDEEGNLKIMVKVSESVSWKRAKSCAKMR